MKIFGRTVGILVVIAITLNLYLFRESINLLKSNTQSAQVASLGSSKMARWYDAHQAPLDVSSKLDSQLASLGNLSKQLLASAGVVISPLETTVKVDPGMRLEEIAELLAFKLNWDPIEIAEFTQSRPMCYLDQLDEGEYLPGTYTFNTFASPVEVKSIMQNNFDEALSDLVVLQNSDDPVIQRALKVASLLQREAAGDGDERIIAGIIWNRLNDDMKLQLDATLQYAKGRPGDWWPIPQSEDKYLDSEFNTYLNNGLPPTPIANPSPEMILAALNPEVTECFFYLHAKRKFYCTPDYKGHLLNIARYL